MELQVNKRYTISSRYNDWQKFLHSFSPDDATTTTADPVDPTGGVAISQVGGAGDEPPAQDPSLATGDGQDSGSITANTVDRRIGVVGRPGSPPGPLGVSTATGDVRGGVWTSTPDTLVVVPSESPSPAEPEPPVAPFVDEGLRSDSRLYSGAQGTLHHPVRPRSIDGDGDAIPE